MTDSQPDVTLRMTPRMRGKLLAAERHARSWGHDDIGTEHVLLAFLDDADGIAGSLLAQQGLAARLRTTLLSVMEQATPRQPVREERT